MERRMERHILKDETPHDTTYLGYELYSESFTGSIGGSNTFYNMQCGLPQPLI